MPLQAMTRNPELRLLDCFAGMFFIPYARNDVNYQLFIIRYT